MNGEMFHTYLYLKNLAPFIYFDIKVSGEQLQCGPNIVDLYPMSFQAEQAFSTAERNQMMFLR